MIWEGLWLLFGPCSTLFKIFFYVLDVNSLPDIVLDYFPFFKLQYLAMLTILSMEQNFSFMCYYQFVYLIFLLLLVWSFQRDLCQGQGPKTLPTYFLLSHIVPSIASDLTFELIFVAGGRQPAYFHLCGYPIFLATFIENFILSSLCILTFPVKNMLIRNSFLPFCSVHGLGFSYYTSALLVQLLQL